MKNTKYTALVIGFAITILTVGVTTYVVNSVAYAKTQLFQPSILSSATPRVALQIGHWKNNELPDELDSLRGSSLGSHGGGVTEPEAMLVIAEKTAELLEPYDVEIELLPATIPPNYTADAFVALHADGSENRAAHGFSVSRSGYSLTPASQELSGVINAEYQAATGLVRSGRITRAMRYYYGFNWLKYEHSIHPQTPAAILETAFLTNAADQDFLINQADIVAEGVANSIITFLELDLE